MTKIVRPGAAPSFVLWVFLSCAGITWGAEEPWTSWRHALGREHPLVGRVWDVRNTAWVESKELARRLGRFDFVLLGEKHDNADHHRLQAWLIRSLVAGGRRPAVVFEMLRADDQPAVDRQLDAAPADIQGFREAVRWEEKGWPSWEIYEPVFAAALTNRLAVLAGNLSTATVQKLAATGISALEPKLVRDFGLDRPLTPEIQRRLTGELEASHCGHISAGAVEKMVLVQRARDAGMARQLTRKRREGGAVLIAGAFHVRKDYGVPAYLITAGVQGESASLAFLEVREEAVHPDAYAEAFGAEALPFDFVWFTPRVDDDDPCEKFAEQLQRLQKS